VLLADILADQWRGPANDIDWDIAQARVLFADFAGMRRNSPRFDEGVGYPLSSGGRRPRVAGMRIPTQSGHRFRIEAGRRSDLMPATIPK
jgi:hypothetical protein